MPVIALGWATMSDVDVWRRRLANQLGEVEARRALRELGEGHLVVGLGRVAAVDPGPVRLGDLGLEGEDRLGARRGIGLAGERQHVGQMRRDIWPCVSTSLASFDR